jgi:hypothetical protein
MGSDRDALVNQAMHVFARLNGFVVPGNVAAPPPAPARTPPPTQRRAVAERVLETAERLERDIARPPPVPAACAVVLRVQLEGGEPRDVAKDRFVIGRGTHCDLVIESGKISREHAALVRKSDGWWIEDLGSSNGTWYRGERIDSHPIADGDEYFLCSEKLRCELR